MNTGEKYLALAPLTDALRAEGITVSEKFVAALLASGAPHITVRRRPMAKPSRVLAYWRARPDFLGPNITATPAPLP